MVPAIDLVAGANRLLPPGPVALAVAGPFDLSAVVLSEGGAVAGDADFVFFNQPTAPGVRLAGGSVTVEPAALRRGAARVVLVASPQDQASSFARLPVPTLTVSAGGSVLTRFRAEGLASETVVQLAEVYRHNGAWKLRAIGQGYADGLAGLARDFGVTVDDDGGGARSATLPSSPAAPTSDGGLLHEVVTATNAERARFGLAALTPEPRLAAAAQAHGQDMVARRFFSHDSPDGRSVADRVLAVGYAYRVVAENIAAGQQTAAEVVDGWMNSPGHRANILSRDVAQIGVGFAVGGEYGTMWVQVFGTPR
jgi:stress response protein SCP2